MSEMGERRLQAIERAFLAAIVSEAEREDGGSPWDPVRSLNAVSVTPEAGSPGFAPVSALLLAELVQWETLGLNLGVLEGSNSYRDAVNESQVLKVFFELESRAFGNKLYVETASDFQKSIAAAIEDLRPERLELVRIMTVSPQRERAARIGEVAEVVMAVEAMTNVSILPASSWADRIAWALSGRESADVEWSSPSAWRSNSALRSSPGMEELDVACARLAISVISAELGYRVDEHEIYDLIWSDGGERYTSA